MLNESKQDYLDILGEMKVDDLYIQQAFNYYHQRFLLDESIQIFVEHSSRIPDDIKSNIKIGYCDRTLGLEVANSRTFDGGAFRGSLQRFGLIKATGHELFRGCVVFPMMDKNGLYDTAVGYRAAKRIRHWELSTIYWDKPAPHEFIKNAMNMVRSLINEKALL